VKLSMALATSFLSPLVQIARVADEGGLHRIWTTEGFGGDGLIRAGHLLANTERIGIGTGIAYAFTRAPLATAMAAADLAELSGGRFTLGLGAGTQGQRVRRFDVEFDHPAPRMAEYARLVRAALDTEVGLRFEGRFYRADFPQYEPTQSLALRKDIRLYAAALNPVMLREAARSCDGIALHSLAQAPQYLAAEVLPAIRQRPGGVPVAAWKIAVVSDDLEQARRAARRQLAFYFSTPSYHGVLAGTGWEEAAQRMYVRAREIGYRDWHEVGRLVPQDMLDAFSLVGGRDGIAEAAVRVAERLAPAGVDELVLQLASDRSEEQTVRHGVQLALAATAAVEPVRALEVAVASR
jgi:alkanesulfonate monooxygenase SsuD/methylene tetrahydromethanopterin reductase-like flavin-dependent oxidoreductase (luciferase family)